MRFLKSIMKKLSKTAAAIPTAKAAASPEEVAKREVSLVLGEMPRLITRWIDQLVVHCSASPNDRDIGAAEIRTWHMRDNGWTDIGYHFVIRRNGVVEKGRDLNIIGAHVSGHNSHSVGICLIGDNVFTDAQIASLKELLHQLRGYMKSHKWPDAVVGHYELFAGKTCPNIDMNLLRQTLVK